MFEPTCTSITAVSRTCTAPLDRLKIFFQVCAVGTAVKD